MDPTSASDDGAHGSASADPLAAPPPVFDEDDAVRIARDVFGLDGSATSLASERDRNFRVDARGGRSLVLKLQNPADGVDVVDFQTRALLHIERVEPSLPVVRVVPVADGTAHWRPVEGSDGRTSLARAFVFLPGHNPSREELDERALFEWGATVARLARALRGFFHPAARYEIQWDVLRAPLLRGRLDSVSDDGRRALVAEVLDRFDVNVGPVAASLRAQVVHDDMSLDNVLVDRRGRITGIVDFGDMTHTALVSDLAATVADVMDGRPDALVMAEPMVAGYQSVTALEAGEAAVLGDLVAARCAAAIVIAAWRLRMYPGNAYVETFDEGAWALLQLLATEGFGRVAERFRAICERGGLPYRSASPGGLLERRRAVLGPATLSYSKPVHLLRGDGVWVFDTDGRRFLDCYNNVPVVGHGHPRVVDAVATQMRRLNTNTRYLHEAVVEVSERLLATMPDGFDRVAFVNSGSEANDVAWRIARFATGRRGAIVTRFAYHGVTEATTDLSPEEWPPGFVPRHVERVPAPDGYRGEHRRDEPGWEARCADRVRHAADGLVARGVPPAAMIADAAFTSDGVLGPVPEYLHAAADAVHDAGGLLIADEVQAGYGRSGEHLWSFFPSAARADLVTLGKPMGNGFPVAAVLTRSELFDPFAKATGFFSTFGGNPVACAAALAVLQIIEEQDVIANAAATGGYLMDGLRSLMERHEAIGDVRGRGLMLGVELVADRGARTPSPGPAARVVNALRDDGVLIGATGPGENVLKVRPPLLFQRTHADVVLEALDGALRSRT